MTRQLNHDFENEVRRLARAKWPSAQYSGAQMLEGRERDGIFETDESVNFVEATVSGAADKARDDSKKLFKAISDHNRTNSLKIGIGWFVTKNEPTADQRKMVQEHGKGQVRAVSFAQFQQSLIDVRAYLAARKNHFFGSVQDFSSGSKIPSVPFIEIGLSNTCTAQPLLVNDLVEGLLNGTHYTLIGQYGSGKSMTMREIFIRLADKYTKGGTPKFPVYINLREHSGQREPVEILERHARSIGFESPSSLVRAWRAGFVVLLADGFDEVTSLGVQGLWKKLKDLRKRSLEGIRKLIRDSVDTGIVVGGRSYYFEDEKELFSALGLHNANALSVDAFTDEQMQKFLARFPDEQHERTLPNWLPTRPLLLGYLASRGLLGNITNQSDATDAVDGWDYLLGRIYEREEGIETNLDGATLRRILERAATLARVTEEGLGPIKRSDLFSVFNDVCGYEPDEQGVLAIQRLPGLGIYRAEDESRCFVDKELADVCTGRELMKFIDMPYDAAKDQIWVDVMNSCDRPISPIGAEFTIRRLKESSDARGTIRQAVAFLNSRSDLACARGDIAAILVAGDIALDLPLSVKEMNYSGTTVEFHNEIPDLQTLTFSHCLFQQIFLESAVKTTRLPHFDNCLFEQISGRVSVNDLPNERFSDTCEFVSFEGTGTSGAIRATHMSTGEKVLLITLRKLFVQSLSGRSESALFRGLDVDERRCVADVLKLMKRHELAIEYSRGNGVVWLPARKSLDRVKRILSAPSQCNEPIVLEARLVS